MSYPCPDGAPGPCDEHGRPEGVDDGPVFLERPAVAVPLLGALAATAALCLTAGAGQTQVAGLFALVAAVLEGRYLFELAAAGFEARENIRRVEAMVDDFVDDVVGESGPDRSDLVVVPDATGARSFVGYRVCGGPAPVDGAFEFRVAPCARTPGHVAHCQPDPSAEPDDFVVYNDVIYRRGDQR